MCTKQFGYVLFGETIYCKVEYGNFTGDEYLLALRPENKLTKLRAANASPYSKRRRFKCVRWTDDVP